MKTLREHCPQCYVLVEIQIEYVTGGAGVANAACPKCGGQVAMVFCGTPVNPFSFELSDQPWMKALGGAVSNDQRSPALGMLGACVVSLAMWVAMGWLAREAWRVL